MADLAGYEFVQTVGKGAMGAVYLARQIALNRYVAAKQILGAWNGEPEVLARFQREAQALAKMNHPNVVGIYDLAPAGNDLFMIMEYVRGPSLRQLMDRSPLTIPQALRVLAEVSAALEYASKMSIIHRDLKPGNVFITAAGVSKLGDFGLVKMLSGQANFVTQVGTILGTPAYMSPEQAGGKPNIDQRADVYSLTCMAYELLTGRLPFPSIPGNIMASLDAHISAPVPKPSTFVPGFPKKVEEVLLEGLAKDPKKRPKSAGDLWRKLSEAAGKAWPGWDQQSDLSVMAAAASPPAPPPLPEPGSMVTPVPTLPLPETAPAPVSADETVVLVNPSPTPSLADETVVMGAGAASLAGDETVVLGAGATAPSPDETVVLPQTPPLRFPPPPSAPASAPAFVPPPPPPPMAPAPSIAVPAFAPPPPAPMIGVPPAGPIAAAPPLPPAPAATGSWSAPQVAPPVYQPPKPAKQKKKGGAGRFFSLVLLLLVLAGLGAFLVVGPPHILAGGTPLGGGAPVAVTGAAVTVEQATGHCPRFTFKFTGKITATGQNGSVRYQWIKPDGKTTPIVTESVPLSDSTLQFTYQGDGGASGDAVLHVLSPFDIMSAPVHITYECP